MKRGVRLLLSVVALAAIAVGATGCQLFGGGGEPQVTSEATQAPSVGATQTPTQTPTPSVEPSVSSPQGGVPLARLKISLAPVADGLDSPLYVANAGDGSGRLFVVEQTGKVRVIRDGKVLPGAFVDVTSRISTGGERGLLGLAFAPDYKTSGRFYLNYTDRNGDTNVVRFVASPPSSDTPKLTGPARLLYIKQPYANHNGGCVQFGPDGMLYVGMGDGGSGGDPENRAQNLNEALGKMLRIDVRGTTYTAPKDNPYAGGPYPRNIIWALGVRNPWRFSFDAKTGDLWIGDVGQNKWEEIDVVTGTAKAVNYGWNRWEANHPYPPDATRSRKGFQFPIVEYPHPTGESVTGGYVYRGSKYPAMVGTYLYADYVKGWIAGVKRRGAKSGQATQTQRVARHRLQHQQLRSGRGQRALRHRAERRRVPRRGSGEVGGLGERSLTAQRRRRRPRRSRCPTRSRAGPHRATCPTCRSGTASGVRRYAAWAR